MTSQKESSSLTSSSLSSSSNSPPPPPLVQTPTTVLQSETEMECQPYFVNLSTLPTSQLDHLRSVGLLPSDGGDDDNDDDDTNNNNNNKNTTNRIQLLRSKHQRYVQQVWKDSSSSSSSSGYHLKAPFVSLDASRPWILYWCLHSYDLLQQNSNQSQNQDQDQQSQYVPLLSSNISHSDGITMVETLRDCFQPYYFEYEYDEYDNGLPSSDGSDSGGLFFTPHPMDKDHENNDNDNETDDKDRPNKQYYYCGGFGGGPGQMAHAATTYAAVLALCILATSSTMPDSSSTQSDTEESLDDDDDEHSSSTLSSTTTPVSILALELLQSVRIPLYRWFVSLQVQDDENQQSKLPSSSSLHTGGFRMHHDGEVDVRATYCVMTVMSLLGLLKFNDNDDPIKPTTTTPATTPTTKPTIINMSSAMDYVIRCQTYEGGIGGEPWSEAHGGYTFCGIAALQCMGYFHSSSSQPSTTSRLDVEALIGWLARRQQSYEGGFCGRSNKLVDGCYSFWQGGAIAIASSAATSALSSSSTHNDPWLESYRNQKLSTMEGDKSMTTATTMEGLDLDFPLLFDVAMLERYILLCAQEIEGGLRDKPSKPRDFYHTCYNLSGLSVAQNCSNTSSNDDDNIDEPIFGDPEQTRLAVTHPVYNIRIERVDLMLKKSWDGELVVDEP